MRPTVTTRQDTCTFIYATRVIHFEFLVRLFERVGPDLFRLDRRFLCQPVRRAPCGFFSSRH